MNFNRIQLKKKKKNQMYNKSMKKLFSANNVSQIYIQRFLYITIKMSFSLVGKFFYDKQRFL